MVYKLDKSNSTPITRKTVPIIHSVGKKNEITLDASYNGYFPLPPTITTGPSSPTPKMGVVVVCTSEVVPVLVVEVVGVDKVVAVGDVTAVELVVDKVVVVTGVVSSLVSAVVVNM